MDNNWTQPWIPLLSKLKLSRQERHIVKQFQNTPQSRSFLSVSEILAKHDHRDESLELLIQGLHYHPNYQTARVKLAQELFQRGLMEQAWETLTATTTSLAENFTAQKTKLQLAIVLEKEFAARETISHLKRRNMLDQETHNLCTSLQTQEFRKCAQRYKQHLRHKGILLDQPLPAPTSTQIPPPSRRYHHSAPAYDAAFLDSLKGFHRIDIHQLGSLAQPRVAQEALHNSHVDALTLAGIYEEQGLHQKAYDIYIQLLNKAPSSHLLQQKTHDLKKRLAPIAEHDTPTSPELASKALGHRNIDQKIHTLRGLLNTIEAQNT